MNYNARPGLDLTTFWLPSPNTQESMILPVRENRWMKMVIELCQTFHATSSISTFTLQIYHISLPIFFFHRMLGQCIAKFQYVDINDPDITDRKGQKFNFDKDSVYFQTLRQGLEGRLPNLTDKVRNEK